MKNYTLTHLHSIYSIGDSTTPPEAYIDRAKELGMKAIVMTEHGNVFNWVKKKQLCDKAGIKFILGVEAYLTRQYEPKVKDNYHTILIAKNKSGIEELLELIANSTTEEHFYHRPRISFEDFCNISDNIITTSACLGSPLANLDESDEWFEPLVKRYDYLEIQPHNIDRQKEHNKKMFEIAMQYDKQLISGTDVHEIDEYKLECRAIWQIGQGFKDDVLDFDLTFKTYDELVDMYRKQDCLPEEVYLKAIENTNIVADMTEEINLDYTFKYPELYENPIELMRDKCYSSLVDRIKSGEIEECEFDKYASRIDEEISVYEKQGMGSFIMFFAELTNYCLENDIPIGFGRGSVTGSLICYLLNITDVNSIKWDTNFARFVNEGRISLGDIDSDFSPSDRQRVYQYIINRFSENGSAYILTFQKLGVKRIIDDVGRALGMSVEEKKRIKDGYEIFEKRENSLKRKLDDGYISEKEYEKESEELQKEIDDYMSQYEDIFKYYKGLSGAISSTGMHAAGMVGSTLELVTNIGLHQNRKRECWVTQCDMKSIDSLNFVKYDILSLKTLQVLRDTFRAAGIKYPRAKDINWEDENVFKDMITSNIGLFQMENLSSFDYLKKFNPKSVEDISFVNAFIRPSCASFRDDAVQKIYNTNPTKEIDELLSSTYGYLVYQEQIIKFLQVICGFTESEADTIRRCIHKDSLVTLSSGKRVPIKDINIGDEVLCVDDSMMIRKSKVTNKWNNGVRHMLKIKTKLGHEIICTPDHKMLSNGKWVEAKDLKTGDCLYTNKINDVYYDNLKPNQRPNNIGYAIGAILGDGYIKDNSISITNSELDIHNKIKEQLQKTDRHNKNTYKMTKIDGKTVDNIYIMRATGENISNVIKKYDIKELAGTKKIPERFMNLSPSKPLYEIIAGLFNTDGYVVEEKYIEYSTKSKTLADNIQQSLLKIGVFSYIMSKKIKKYGYNMYTLRISTQTSYDNFKKYIVENIVGHKKEKMSMACDIQHDEYVMPNYCAEEMDLAILNCKRSFRDMFGSLEYKKQHKKSASKAKKICEKIYCPDTQKLICSDLIPIEIESIEKYGEDECYDIEVGTYHNFIANGLVTHNCIGKKDKKLLDEWLPKVEAGYIKNSSKPEEEAREDFHTFYVILQNASDYGFSRNHSIAYSMITYMTTYARYYYPAEFICAYLNNAANHEDVASAIELAKLKNIKIESPTYGKSKGDDVVIDGVVYKGVKSILTVSDVVGDNLYDFSIKNTCNSFLELLCALQNEKITNVTNMTALIKCGYFREFGGGKKLLKLYEVFKDMEGRKQLKKDADILKERPAIKKIIIKKLKQNTNGYSCTEKIYKIDWLDIVKTIDFLLPDEEFTIKERVENQLLYMKYIQDKSLSNIKIADVICKSKYDSWLLIIDEKKYWVKNTSGVEIDRGDKIIVNTLTSYTDKRGRVQYTIPNITKLNLELKKKESK